VTSPIHPAAAEGFAVAAETYVRGRPDYPPEALEWLRSTLALQRGKIVIDLGAGTGKFTKLLVATGAHVIALEPVAPMLDQLTQRMPHVEARVGDAEHIPLPDRFADALVCAQSFHWFARPSAIAEIRRVLKPGGVFGLIWNVRDESVDWVARLSRLIEPYEGDAPRVTDGTWRELFPAHGFGSLLESRFPHAHVGQAEHVIVDRVASISFIAALPFDERESLLARVRELIRTTPALTAQGEVRFPYQTAAYHCIRE
jgi:SAM-dependent methyltransferase